MLGRNGTVVELLVFRNDVVGVGLSSAGHLGHAGVVSTVSTSSIVFVVEVIAVLA